MISVSLINYFAFNTRIDIWHVCESRVFGPGVHYHARVCVEQAEPQRAHELLRPAELPGPFFAMGPHGILPVAG